jgi:hypothetical protein
MSDFQFMINKGLHWVGIPKDSMNIIQKPFEWDNESYQTGHSFESLGTKNRTSLNIGTPLVYSGFLIDRNLRYVLFDVAQKEARQMDLFSKNDINWYIAPMYVDKRCLLMPSSYNGYYDIRP